MGTSKKPSLEELLQNRVYIKLNNFKRKRHT